MNAATFMYYAWKFLFVVDLWLALLVSGRIAVLDLFLRGGFIWVVRSGVAS